MSELIFDFTTGCYRDGKELAVGESSRNRIPDEWDIPLDNGLIYDYGLGGYIPAGQLVASEAVKTEALRKAFDGVFKNVTIDRRLATKIRLYVSGVFNREGNVEWFGSNLLGVHTIRFYDSDRNRLFDEVLEVDEDLLEAEIAQTKTINADWAVAGNTFNLTIAYMIHAMYPKFSDKEIYGAAVDLVKLLQFKFYSSIYYHFFPKPVDLPAAEAAYSMLSLKFDIRRMGNWGLHMTDRAEYFVSKECPHYNEVKAFNHPDLLIRFITDLNTRTKQTVKDYYAVLDAVRRSNARVLSQSSRIDLDGESIIRDKVTALNTAKQTLIDSSYDINNFYKEELARVALEMVPKASPVAMKTVLFYIASLPLGKQRSEVESIMNDALAHAFDLIVTNRINFKDVAFLLNRMRALYQSSKSTNEYVLSLRDRLEKLVKKETHLTHTAALAAVRNALLLYFLVRAIAS
ncbi:hypothetical protein pEaSNUABM42_00275 [Erwinia phage pEa_SNUABM_42]|nr:hypothetical protein pEaSNUABM43_00276 [Erwinia phage pEa_SNUABM_43]QVW55592.1 hypothetical protein pEaSNUABM42_00275 [Erwinia phage pEa_SNUABM_42]